MALQVGELVALLSLDNSGFERGLSTSTSGMDGLKRAAVTAAVGIGAAMAGAAIYSLGQFSDFQAGMNEVFTLLPGISQQAMDSMSDDVKNFARDYGVLPDKVIPALYQSLSAGIPKENVFAFLGTAQTLARAGVTDLETAVDGLTSTVNAYGQGNLSAAQASDIMVTAVRVGKTTVGELSDALFQVNPIASSVGVNFGTVAAAMSTMTSQGVPTAVAATQLRQMLTELSKGGQQAADTFTSIAGQSFPQFIAGGGTMQQALQMLVDHADATGSSVSDMFGSVEAGQAALALTGPGAATFASNLDAMSHSAGATQTAYERMTNGIKFQLDKLKAWLSVMVLNIGQKVAEVAQPILEFGTKLANVFAARGFQGALDFLERKFSQLSGPVKALVVGLGAFAAVLAAGAVIALVVGLGAALASVVSGAALVAVGIAALAAGVVYAYTHWEGFRDVINAVVSWMVNTAWPWIQNFVAGVAEQWAHLVAWTRQHWDAITEAVAHVIVAFVAWFQTFWAAWGDSIVSIAQAAWDLVRGTVESAVTIISGIIDAVLAIINGDWGDAWDAILQVLRGFWSQAGNLIQFWLSTIQAVIVGALNGLMAYWQAGWALMGTLLSAAWDAFQAAVSAGISAVLGFLASLPGKILQALAALPGLLTSIGSALMHGLLSGIQSGWAAVLSWLAGLGGRIVGVISGAVGSLASIGRAIMNGLWDGLKAGWHDVTGWLSGLNPAAHFNDINPYKGHAEKNLRPLGEAVMGGLQAGMARRWDGITRWLAGIDPSSHLGAGGLGSSGGLAGLGHAGGTTYIDESRFIVVRSIDEAAGHARPHRRREVAAFLRDGRS